MGPIEIVASKIKAIADAIRDKTGTTAPLTLDEMAESIVFLEGDGGPLQTFILVDEDGHEMECFLTEEEVELTATPNDIRIGTTAVTDTGVTVGEKEIPAYHTEEGYVVVTPGSVVQIKGVEDCDYTKLLAMVCSYNSTVANSVSTEKVCINRTVYLVNSTETVSTVTTDIANKTINFGVTNNSGKPQILRYILYKEIY